jgi:hypothetical protein
MVSKTATTSTERRQLLVEAIVAHRRAGDPVVFEAAGRRITYDDQRLRVELVGDERNRLDELLSAYHVFKVKQPETRKAVDGIVYLSAVTDPKHASDFIESLFREVYEFPAEYELESSVV